ncbi:MAG: YdiU family protein [Pelagibacterales bacterium]|nr:YdiU family protein [Pelagibacterales bacterium]
MKINFKFDNSYTQLTSMMMAKVMPAKVKLPKLVLLNYDLAEKLGLNFSSLDEKQVAELFTGNTLPEGANPIAQAYAGHQFGHLTILGDGRAIVLGEHITPTNQRYDIQFKGSGRTPYSRGGDGKAALGPMLREYIISEAMYHLNIRTTRSLAVTTTGENVMRETVLPGAILTRVAESHIRVGTFEYVAIKRDIQTLKKLLQYSIDRHYPEIKDLDKQAPEFLKLVMERQIDLITDWMRVGFIHGVMNTDNMSISGESIDFGPCAFMDYYNPKTVFSSIDHHGRYAFGNQPSIAQWNLARLADALLPLLDEDQNKAIEVGEEIIHSFKEKYEIKFHKMMKKKLGLITDEVDDVILIQELLDTMEKNKLDYTNTFRDLMNDKVNNETLKIFKDKWKIRIDKQNRSHEEVLTLMRNNNPVVIPRNHKVEESLKEAHKGNLVSFNNLLNALKDPYTERNNLALYQQPAPETDKKYKTFCGT